ncbi:hypothetical protein [Brassicibacter mesophilus]
MKFTDKQILFLNQVSEELFIIEFNNWIESMERHLSQTQVR